MKTLFGGGGSLDDLLEAYNIRVSTVPMYTNVYGFTYYGRTGRYHIILNENIGTEVKEEVFLHEIHHIIEDRPKMSYCVGFGMRCSPVEREADAAADEILQNLHAAFLRFKRV
jgi:Zn-dependent peptidase ImmA (M78 family)